MKHISSGADKIMLYIIGGFTVLIIAVIAVFSLGSSKQTNANSETAAYSTTDS